jgi:hypothetical protein
MFSPDIITCLACGSTDMNCEFKVAVVPKAQLLCRRHNPTAALIN